MQYNFYFLIITYLLTSITSSHAMEQKSKFDLNNIQEIVGIKNARCIRYTKNNCIVMSSDSECNLIDPKTKKLLKSIDCGSDPYGCKGILRLQQCMDNKIILSSSAGVMIYNVETKKNEWFTEKIKNIRSIAVHAPENSIFISSKGRMNKEWISEYNYVSNKSKIISISDGICDKMAIHPKKEIICMCIAEPHCSSRLYLRKLNNLTEDLKTISLFPFPKSYFCEYSPDGTYLIIGDDEIIRIIEPDKDQLVHPYLKAPEYEEFKNIAFHPNGLILATLMQRYISSSQSIDIVGITHYWDLKTKKLISSTPEFPFGKSYDFSFSDDGLEVAIALEKACIRTLVPFAVKEKCSYLLLVLQKKLPRDLAKYCINVFLQNLCF